MTVAGTYPSSGVARDRFVLAHRGPRPRHDPWRHQSVLVERERTAEGASVSVATIFLTGRECPWRCVMCDLWMHTIDEDTPVGALPSQLDAAIGELRQAGSMPSHVKLYNAGSFFDPRAVPVTDYDAIASRLMSFDHVIVESHPTLVGHRVERFQRALARVAHEDRPPSLEVAMGLETAHPSALERLHKRFTLQQFASAAERLRDRGARLRVFLLVGVPFIPNDRQGEWIERSVAFAFACGASVVSLIPTRPGNGALEVLASDGMFEPPALRDLEDALDRALASRPAGRVFADLWDLERLAACRACFADRRERLRLTNLEQGVSPAVHCERCCAGGHVA
jgi:radical SAM enzyme (TIGR01210 family)